MIEAIAVMQDKIAAHSFDEPTGELGLPADARSGDRELGGQARLQRARHYGSLCHAAPRISCCVPMAGRMWNATLSWRCAP